MWLVVSKSAQRPWDAAGLAAFRVLFGVVAAIGATRFVVNGWVERCFVRPTFFFHYWGFEWVRVLPEPWMTVLFGVMAVAGVCIALGLAYRVATWAFFLAFTYVELSDVTNYLNHYYLVSLLAFLMCWLPLNRAMSLDVRLGLAKETLVFPAWMTWLLRFQVGVVYFYAGIAKAQPDWLLHGQPLSIWLSSRTHLPVVGPYLAEHWVALAMSWGGFLYDTTIPFWLSWRRSRPIAYVVVLCFHTVVGVLFDIGMFPVIMTTAALVFFSPSWPRKLWAALRRRAPAIPEGGAWALPSPRWQSVGAVLFAGWVAFQLLMPIRCFAYGGNVIWHEQGMRWSWRVMLREKNGSVMYRVRAEGWDHERWIDPSRYLNRHQERELAGQPDLILQLAHHIRDELRAAGEERVEVYAEALVSLNGRPMARLVDPAVDLAQVSDSMAPAQWILAAPEGPPPHLRSRAVMARGTGDTQ